MSKKIIEKVTAMEILDSRGNPTVEAIVVLDSGEEGVAKVPSGASTGSHEAWELRDGDKSRFGGKGVTEAVKHISREIANGVEGMDVMDLRAIDEKMLALDGTANKEKLGANAILAVSMACAQAGAVSVKKPLFMHLRELFWPELTNWLLPVPMMNVMNGGKHAVGSVDMQEFMVMPIGAPSFREGLRWSAEVYHKLQHILHEKDLPIGVGDEGGFMPKLDSHVQVLELMREAVQHAGYDLGRDFVLALDPAASEIFNEGHYDLKIEGLKLSTSEMIDLYEKWMQEFPIRSIEDGLSEDDWDGFKEMTERLGKKLQIVGDDLFVTNVKRLERGIEFGAANSVLVKPNQIGSVTETVDLIKMAQTAGFTAVISHRSGETDDTFIADLAVAANAGQIKTGSPARGERVAKYNRLLRITAILEEKAEYPQLWR